MLHYRSYAVTDIGRVRAKNEDNFFVCGKYKADTAINCLSVCHSEAADEYLYSVCDGMGGEQFGELASLIAVENLSDYQTGFNSKVQEYIHNVNEKICCEITKNNGVRIGTTFAALCISDDIASIFNIGDTRVYLLRCSELKQLSHDHTHAQLLLDNNIITPEQAKVHPAKHVLSRNLGIFPEELTIEAEKANPVPVEPGDIFLLCSDGLTDMLDNSEIERIISSSPEESSAKVLVESALQKGGNDNITIILVYAE